MKSNLEQLKDFWQALKLLSGSFWVILKPIKPPGPGKNGPGRIPIGQKWIERTKIRFYSLRPTRFGSILAAARGGFERNFMFLLRYNSQIACLFGFASISIDFSTV